MTTYLTDKLKTRFRMIPFAGVSTKVSQVCQSNQRIRKTNGEFYSQTMAVTRDKPSFSSAGRYQAMFYGTSASMLECFTCFQRSLFHLVGVIRLTKRASFLVWLGHALHKSTPSRL